MREIKFRAWDSRDSKWIEVVEIGFCEGDLHYVEDNNCELYFVTTHGKINKKIGVDWHIMQYTGLKDVNGKEIYEGDIVEVSNHPFPVNDNYLVSWNEDSSAYVAGSLVLGRLKPYMQIIGNIYENPELLEVSK